MRCLIPSLRTRWCCRWTRSCCRSFSFWSSCFWSACSSSDELSSCSFWSCLRIDKASSSWFDSCPWWGVSNRGFLDTMPVEKYSLASRCSDTLLILFVLMYPRLRSHEWNSVAGPRCCGSDICILGGFLSGSGRSCLPFWQGSSMGCGGRGEPPHMNIAL